MHITIQSAEKNASVEIKRRDFEQFTNYVFTASFRGERVRNESVVFTGMADFVRALRAFEQNREGSVRLDGTEDCWLVVEADGKMGHAWLTIQVARMLYSVSPQTGRSKSGRIILSGSFPISGEMIAQTVRDFAELFAEHAHTTA